MPPRNPHTRICVSDTVTPAIPFFNRFPNLCEHISLCQLEAVLPNHLPSRRAEIPFGAKESTFLAPACLEQTTGMFSLNPQLRAHPHLGRNFAFSICLFTTGRMLAKWGALFPAGGFADKPSRLVSLAVSDGVLPMLLVSSCTSRGVHMAARCWFSFPDGFPPACPLKMHQWTDLSAALLSIPCLQNHQHPVNVKTCSPLPLGMVLPHSPSLIPQPDALFAQSTVHPRPSLPDAPCLVLPPHVLHPTQPQPPSSPGCLAGGGSSSPPCFLHAPRFPPL